MAKTKKRKLGAASSVTRHEKRAAQEAKPLKSVLATGPATPFDPENRILLVGEGDFSFAKSIVEHHGCYDITATCFDSQTELFEKYKPQTEEHVQYLEDEGQTVLYDVDATKLDQNKNLKKSSLFDRVVFNFPHVGGKTKDVNRQVRFNQELLVKFFTAAISLLTPSGKIVVTLFEGEPYTLWNIRDLARHSGLEVQRSSKFVSGTFPGYRHSRTIGNIDGGGGWKGEDRDARIYLFQKRGGLPQAAMASQGTRKRMRDGDDESSDEG